MVGEFKEELEPLFDYHRIQPFNVVCLDDDLSDSTAALPLKRRKLSNASVVVEKDGNAIDVEAVDCDGNDDDDWMPPPPKVSSHARKFEEDSTIKELRLKKQELASYAKSAEEVLRTVEQSAERDLSNGLQSSIESDANQPSKINTGRAKIVISIQDKDEKKQFRVYNGEKFERLFVTYAEKNKLDLQSLVFRFDGEKINPSETPDSLGMEDEDIIEVHKKPKS